MIAAVSQSSPVDPIVQILLEAAQRGRALRLAREQAAQHPPADDEPRREDDRAQARDQAVGGMLNDRSSLCGRYAGSAARR